MYLDNLISKSTFKSNNLVRDKSCAKKMFMVQTHTKFRATWSVHSPEIQSIAATSNDVLKSKSKPKDEN